MKRYVKLSIIIIIALFSICMLYNAYNLFSEASPYFENKIHDEKQFLRSFSDFSDNTSLSLFEFKFQTMDGFIADNPIDVTIFAKVFHVYNETNWDIIDKKARAIRIDFHGTEKLFYGEWNFSKWSSPDFPREEFWEEVEKSRIILNKDDDLNTLMEFSGTKHNLTYNIGGVFDIGITIFYEGNWSNAEHKFGNAIEISPPETLISLRTNYYMIGISKIGLALALIGIWATFFIASLNVILLCYQREKKVVGKNKTYKLPGDDIPPEEMKKYENE